MLYSGLIYPVRCFNPRAREGRDQHWNFGGAVAIGFNPRAREGRDAIPSDIASKISSVSIHAPARGATI